MKPDAVSRGDAGQLAAELAGGPATVARPSGEARCDGQGRRLRRVGLRPYDPVVRPVARTLALMRRLAPQGDGWRISGEDLAMWAIASTARPIRTNATTSTYGFRRTPRSRGRYSGRRELRFKFRRPGASGIRGAPQESERWTVGAIMKAVTTWRRPYREPQLIRMFSGFLALAMSAMACIFVQWGAGPLAAQDLHDELVRDQRIPLRRGRLGRGPALDRPCGRATRTNARPASSSHVERQPAKRWRSLASV
jgi:hypothetical protein